MMRYILSIIILIFLKNNNVCHGIQICEEDENINEYVVKRRLPDFIRPKEYFISLEFDDKLESYTATVRIEIEIINSTNYIILHSDGNDIFSSFLYKNTEESEPLIEITFKNMCYVEFAQFLVIELDNYVETNGSYSVSFTLGRNISEEINGIYYSYYRTKENKNMKIVSTHFHDIFARLAFPCFDEPDFKAIFNVQIRHPKTLKALSNSRIRRQIFFDDNVLVIFDKTPLMSSYLLAFILHDFSVISKTTSRGIPINIWLPLDLINYGKFAVNFAPKVLSLFENILRVNFALKKLDLIGLPELPVNAMENWGLITFSMNFILVNDAITSLDEKLNVGYTIAHEISHQWFGNLVTTKWWNDIWLNEGFATFMGHYALYSIQAEYDGFAFYVEREVAMSQDQLITSHPVSLPDDYLGTFENIYDEITYTKGASLLMMLYEKIDEDLFFKIFEKYLKKYEFSNVKTIDFLSVVLMETGDQNLFNYMIHWAKVSGFPLITLEKYGITYKISQERMLVTQNTDLIDKWREEIWSIPVYYLTNLSFDEDSFMLLSKKRDILNISNNKTFIKVNKNYLHYYRSNYDSQILMDISYVLKNNFETLTVSDKIGMIYDTFSMLSNGKQRISVVFDHFEYLKNENDYSVMTVFFNCLMYIERLISDDIEMSSKFNKYILSYTKPITKEKDDEKTKFLTNQSKIMILYMSVNTELDDEETIFKASQLFKDFFYRNTHPDSSILKMASCAFMKKYEDEVSEEINKKFISAFDPTEAKLYLNALGCSNNFESIKKLLQLALNTKIYHKHLIDIILSVNSHSMGSKIIPDFIIENYESLNYILRKRVKPLKSIFKVVFGGYKTENDLYKFKSFLFRYGLTEEDHNIQMVLQIIQNNIFWLNKNREDLKMILSKI